MEKALLIYDNTGRVWSIFVGVEECPPGVQSIIVDVPGEFASANVNTDTLEVTFETPNGTVVVQGEV